MDQIVRCQSSSVGRIIVPGSIRGEPVQFLFGTNTGWWCTLYQSYVEARGLPIFLNDAGRERVRAGEVGLFGRTWQANGIPFGDRITGWDPPLAGLFGAYCLWDCVVAIDASVPAMAVAPSDPRPPLAAPLCRVPLIPKTWKGTCFTAAVNGAVFGIGYEWQSTVTSAYLSKWRMRPGRNGRVDSKFELPGDLAVIQEVGVADDCNAAPLAEAGISVCDGILGADFWCRWVTVFDFAASELLLFSYD